MGRVEEDIKIKRQNKYVPVVEASTDSYECMKCRDIENKQARSENRRLIVNSLQNAPISSYKLVVLMNL